jgi:hypothetical protein
MTYQIEQIPMPAFNGRSTNGKPSSPEWITLEKLEPGQSFSAPTGRAKNAANAISKAHRKWPEREYHCIAGRVYRVK